MKKLIFHVDTNLLNAKQGIHEMNILEKLHDEEKLTLIWSSTAQFEALNNNSNNLKQKANTHIYTINEECEEFPKSISIFQKQIFEIMEINSNSKDNDINDALIICEAEKYSAILITKDGGSNSQKKGILGRKLELSKYVKIVTPSEALKLVYCNE